MNDRLASSIYILSAIYISMLNLIWYDLIIISMISFSFYFLVFFLLLLRLSRPLPLNKHQSMSPLFKIYLEYTKRVYGKFFGQCLGTSPFLAIVNVLCAYKWCLNFQ